MKSLKKSLVCTVDLPELLDDDGESAEYRGDEEFAQAFVSSQGTIEGWLYKTSQAMGLFQSEAFHKRYYRLNMLTEELKVFDKPNGKLKHTARLGKRIM